MFGLIYTLVTIPYATLTASLTSDYEERTKLSTYRIGCAFAGGFSCRSARCRFVDLFDDKAEGFSGLMVLFAVVATVLLWITYKSTAEVVQPPRTAKLPLRTACKRSCRTRRCIS